MSDHPPMDAQEALQTAHKFAGGQWHRLELRLRAGMFSILRAWRDRFAQDAELRPHLRGHGDLQSCGAHVESSSANVSPGSAARSWPKS